MAELEYTELIAGKIYRVITRECDHGHRPSEVSDDYVEGKLVRITRKGSTNRAAYLDGTSVSGIPTCFLEKI